MENDGARSEEYIVRWRDVGARGSGVRSDGLGVPAEARGLEVRGSDGMMADDGE